MTVLTKRYTEYTSIGHFLQIVGRQFDTQNEDDFSRYFETIYALLDKVSPEYRNSFGEALLQKLQDLQQSEELS